MRALFLAAALLLPAVAWAQQPDPRLAGPLLQSMQAQLALQQAIMRVYQQDVAIRDARVAPALNAHRWATNPMAGLGE